MQAVQLQNLSHLFDDLDKAGSDVSECPDTPLHLFPNTPTSELLLQGHFAGAHFAPEAQTPPQVHPWPYPRGRPSCTCVQFTGVCICMQRLSSCHA